MLATESLAQAQREKNDATQQAAELKTKLESAEDDAHARADEATRAAREGVEEREKVAAQRLSAVTNSLLGALVTRCFPLL